MWKEISKYRETFFRLHSNDKEMLEEGNQEGEEAIFVLGDDEMSDSEHVTKNEDVHINSEVKGTGNDENNEGEQGLSILRGRR